MLMLGTMRCRVRRLTNVALAVWIATPGLAQSPGPSGTVDRGTGRWLTVDDILHFEHLTEAQISPDGKSIVYVLVKPGTHNVYGESATLWLLDVVTHKSRLLVSASGNLGRAWGSGNPPVQWSPDGQQVAYLSAQSGRPEIWLLNIATGQSRQLTGREEATDTNGTISEFAISPTGDRLAYVRTFADDARQQRLEQEKVIVLSEHPYFLSPQGANGSYADSAAIEMFVLSSGRSEQVTQRFAGAFAPQWSPDGTRLVFSPSARDRGGKWVAPADPTILTFPTRQLLPLVRTAAIDWSPSWSPEGSTICYLSYILGPFGGSHSLYTLSLADSEPRLISGGDIAVSPQLPIVWAKTHVIYAGSISQATARVYAFAPDGRARTLVTPERFHVRSYSLSADGRRMAAIFENANTPPEVYVGDPVTHRFQQLTRLGSALRGIALGEVDTVWWRSGDGRFDVEGFLVKPPDFTSGKRYPLLVNLHGGPSAAYENGFTDVNFTSGYHTPAQLYAAAGYLVLLPNKRGDESYGADFLSAHAKHLADDVDYDMLAGVDALVTRGLADPNRLGIMGFSYGAYATAWAISHTQRFKAASLSDGPYNLLSYYGQAYLTVNEWMDYYLGGNPSSVQEQYLEKSPILYAAHIQTPALIRIGQARFPRPQAMPLQGMELFRALHERRVPTELLYHPTQGHAIIDEEVYRDWVRRNLAWFDYWVLGHGTNPLERMHSRH